MIIGLRATIDFDYNVDSDEALETDKEHAEDNICVFLENLKLSGRIIEESGKIKMEMFGNDNHVVVKIEEPMRKNLCQNTQQ